MTKFAKRGLIYASSFSTLRMCNLNLVAHLSYHCTNRTENFSLMSFCSACVSLSFNIIGILMLVLARVHNVYREESIQLSISSLNTLHQVVM